MSPSTLARSALTVLVGGFALTGCGTAQDGGRPEVGPAASSQTPTTGPEATAQEATRQPALPDGLTRPADLALRGGGDWVQVPPHTWCQLDGCVDGLLPDPLPDLGTTDDPVLIDLPAGWRVRPTWRPVGREDSCGPYLSGPTQTSRGEPLELPPSGAAGTWALDLIAWRPDGGDVVAAAQVTTTRDAALPAPELRLTSFFDHDGQIVQYGPVELLGLYLSPEPLDPDSDNPPVATLMVTSADGRTSTIELGPVAPQGCVEPGRLLLREEGSGQDPTERPVGEELGAPPYGLTVEVELAGRTYVATATWPDDVSEEDSAIRLEVAPALPRPEPRDLSAPTAP